MGFQKENQFSSYKNSHVSKKENWIISDVCDKCGNFSYHVNIDGGEVTCDECYYE